MFESNKKHIDHRIVFRETFNSEQQCRRNKGIPSNVVFNNSKAILNGTSSKITYPNLSSGNYSIRIKLKRLVIALEYLIDFSNGSTSGVGYILVNSGTGIISRASGTTYINGVQNSVATANTTELIVSGMNITAVLSNFYIGCRNGVSLFANADIELVEIYKGTLTAEEVQLLYENSLYIEPDFNTGGLIELLSITPLKGSIVEKYNANITNVSVPIKRDGNKYVMQFGNIAESRLDIPDDDKYTMSDGDDIPFAILCWIYLYEVKIDLSKDDRFVSKYTFEGNLFEYWFGIADGDALDFIIRDNTTNGYLRVSSLQAPKANSWFLATAKYDGSKDVSGLKMYNNLTEQTYATSVVGTYTKLRNTSARLIIGNVEITGPSFLESSSFNGKMGQFKMIKGNISLKQITQYYNATKHLYGL